MRGFNLTLALDVSFQWFTGQDESGRAAHWVPGDGIRADVFSPRHMDNLKLIGESFLFQVEEASVLDGGEVPVIQYMEEWFVICANNQILAAKKEIPALVETISDCQGLPFYRCIPGLCRVKESATHQTQPPSRGAA